MKHIYIIGMIFCTTLYADSLHNSIQYLTQSLKKTSQALYIDLEAEYSELKKTDQASAKELLKSKGFRKIKQAKEQGKEFLIKYQKELEALVHANPQDEEIGIITTPINMAMALKDYNLLITLVKNTTMKEIPFSTFSLALKLGLDEWLKKILENHPERYPISAKTLKKFAYQAIEKPNTTDYFSSWFLLLRHPAISNATLAVLLQKVDPQNLRLYSHFLMHNLQELTKEEIEENSNNRKEQMIERLELLLNNGLDVLELNSDYQESYIIDIRNYPPKLGQKMIQRGLIETEEYKETLQETLSRLRLYTAQGYTNEDYRKQLVEALRSLQEKLVMQNDQKVADALDNFLFSATTAKADHWLCLFYNLHVIVDFHIRDNEPLASVEKQNQLFNTFLVALQNSNKILFNEVINLLRFEAVSNPLWKDYLRKSIDFATGSSTLFTNPSTTQARKNFADVVVNAQQ